jgi:hypothetical protein
VSEPPVCAVCGRGIERERGEREEVWRSRRACSMGCRDALRRRTQLARAEARLDEAVRTWVPGVVAPSTHAQRHGVTTERFREALRAAGREVAASAPVAGRRGRPPGSDQSAGSRRPRVCADGWPLEDLLLEALVRVYGYRHSPPQQGRQAAAA